MLTNLKLYRFNCLVISTRNYQIFKNYLFKIGKYLHLVSNKFVTLTCSFFFYLAHKTFFLNKNKTSIITVNHWFGFWQMIMFHVR